MKGLKQVNNKQITGHEGGFMEGSSKYIKKGKKLGTLKLEKLLILNTKIIEVIDERGFKWYVHLKRIRHAF